MARSTYFDLSRSADACLGSESGYAQRFQCGNVVKPLIWTGMRREPLYLCSGFLPSGTQFLMHTPEEPAQRAKSAKFSG